MKHLTLFLTALVALALTGCTAPGQGGKSQQNNPNAVAGAQNVGRSQGATSTITIGGDQTYNFNIAGSADNEALLMSIEALNKEIEDFPESGAPGDRAKLVEARSKLIEKLQKVPGVTITLTGDAEGGGADSAAAAGETGVPPATSPDRPE